MSTQDKTRIALITARVQVIDNVPAVSIWLRPLVAADALAFYLRHLAWPAGARFEGSP